MLKLSVFVVIFLMKITTSIAADYSAKTETSDYSCAVMAKYNGEINALDISNFIDKIKIQLKSVCSKGSQHNPILHINSNGGDVNAAMELGKYLRDNNFQIIVGLHSKCLSSCVLVLASGVKKMAFGDVGVHRPYFVKANPNATINEIRQIRRDNDKFITEYLNMMDVPLSLLDLMNATPPEKIKILSQEELQFYRLDGTDASYNEKEVAESAYVYGINSSEYRNRYDIVSKLRSEKKCNPDTNCLEILYGLNTSEFISRSKKSYSNCAQLEKTKYVECWRNTMLNIKN